MKTYNDTDILALTADVVERKTGKWLESKESISRPYMCSNCGCLYDVDTIMGKLCWNFCPNCGAEMDERRDDEESAEGTD